MNKEKTGAELIVETLDENKAQIQALAEKTTEELKSVGDKIALGLKEAFEGQSKEEIKSLKDQMANKDEELKALRSGHGVGKKESKEEEHKALVTFASKLKSEGKVDLNSEEYKAIRFSDPTSTGYGQGTIEVGEIETNKQPIVTILNDIDVLPAVADNDKTISWKGFDESLVAVYESNEMTAAQVSEAVKNSLIELAQRKVKAMMPFSDDVIIAATSGRQLPVLNRNLSTLEKVYDRKLAANVFQDIIKAVNASAVGKVASSVAEAPATAAAREDLRMFPSSLKVQYVSTSVMYISRAFLNALYSKEASDGHLATEQFVYSNGITYFVTPEKAIPVRVFEHAQIGDYKSLADGSTAITSDYVNGSSTNTGKLLAFVGDLKAAYKMIPSSFGRMDIDTSTKSILVDGYCVGGKVSYAAQGVVAKEAIKVFYAN